MTTWIKLYKLVKPSIQPINSLHYAGEQSLPRNK